MGLLKRSRNWWREGNSCCREPANSPRQFETYIQFLNLNLRILPSFQFPSSHSLLPPPSLPPPSLLSQSSRTSLSTLTSLHVMFSTEVREYRDALSPYRIPSSCNTTICTRGDIHAEELFRNLSEIRKLVCV